jgi:hypothetical protein
VLVARVKDKQNLKLGNVCPSLNRESYSSWNSEEGTIRGEENRLIPNVPRLHSRKSPFRQGVVDDFSGQDPLYTWDHLISLNPLCLRASSNSVVRSPEDMFQLWLLEMVLSRSHRSNQRAVSQTVAAPSHHRPQVIILLKKMEEETMGRIG